MLTKLKAVLNVFRKGERVADPTTWETSGAITAALVPFLLALNEAAAAFGFVSGVSAMQLELLAHGIASACGVYATIAMTVSSRRLGLLPGKPQA